MPGGLTLGDAQRYLVRVASAKCHFKDMLFFCKEKAINLTIFWGWVSLLPNSFSSYIMCVCVNLDLWVLFLGIIFIILLILKLSHLMLVEVSSDKPPCCFEMTSIVFECFLALWHKNMSQAYLTFPDPHQSFFQEDWFLLVGNDKWKPGSASGYAHHY